MKHQPLTLLLILGSIAVAATHALANVPTGTGFAGDDIIARGLNSFWTVWVPLLITAGIVGVCLALYTGHRLSQKALGLVGIVVLLGGGVAYVASQMGVSIASGATLHEEATDAPDAH